ncbi:MAG: alpha/beta hydrolase, partial [Clostridiales bacterium]|nr:alpha/beta hydrolase [Clostridiales bacterium]
MEVRPYTYEEFPEFTEPVEGAHIIETTGDEMGVLYQHDVEYDNVNGVSLRLQILIPNCRNDKYDFMS